MQSKGGSGSASGWRGQHLMGTITVLICLLPFAAIAVFAQESEPGTASLPAKPSPSAPDKEEPQKAEETSQKTSSSSRRGSFIGLPVPISSPAVGSGVTLMGGYIFSLRKSDKVSPPSLIGGAWVGTDNGTRAWAAAAELYFNQDRYHMTSAFAHADLNYYFYGTGTSAGNAGVKFGLNQTGDVFTGEALRRIAWKFFIGPRVWIATTRIAAQHAGESFPDLPPFNVTFDTNSLGFKLERDTRPNRFYPEKGTDFEFRGDYFSKEIGSTFSFQSYRMVFNTYHSFDQKQVLAYNLYACSTGGGAPFFGECIFGVQNELRGYPAGRYIDRKMLATQVEYRRLLPWRFGVAVFGGLGEVAPTVSSFDAENVLPSIGLGPRFSLSTKYHVNIRGDFAWGKNGNTFSMGLGEAF